MKHLYERMSREVDERVVSEDYLTKLETHREIIVRYLTEIADSDYSDFDPEIMNLILEDLVFVTDEITTIAREQRA